MNYHEELEKTGILEVQKIITAAAKSTSESDKLNKIEEPKVETPKNNKSISTKKNTKNKNTKTK